MISVCLATYNGGKFISEQLASILLQLNEYDEVIISDDKSTDNTVGEIISLNDKRIKLIVNEAKSGPVNNFENALLNASGDYVFLSDQDDVWMPEKVKIMLESMHEGYDLVLSDCKLTNEKLEVFNESYFEFNKSSLGIFKNFYKNSYMGCCMAFNKSVLKACLPFPIGLPMHDSYIGLLAELKFKVKLLDKPLILHRKHGDNNSDTASGKSRYKFKKKFIFRLQLLAALTTRYLNLKNN